MKGSGMEPAHHSEEATPTTPALPPHPAYVLLPTHSLFWMRSALALHLPHTLPLSALPHTALSPHHHSPWVYTLPHMPSPHLSPTCSPASCTLSAWVPLTCHFLDLSPGFLTLPHFLFPAQFGPGWACTDLGFCTPHTWVSHSILLHGFSHLLTTYTPHQQPGFPSLHITATHPSLGQPATREDHGPYSGGPFNQGGDPRPPILGFPLLTSTHPLTHRHHTHCHHTTPATLPPAHGLHTWVPSHLTTAPPSHACTLLHLLHLTSHAHYPTHLTCTPLTPASPCPLGRTTTTQCPGMVPHTLHTSPPPI